MTALFTSELLWAIPVVLVAGLMRGFSGFGGVMIMAPGLGAIYGPALAVPVCLMLDLIVSIPFAPMASRTAHWRSILVLAGVAALAVPFGATVLLMTDADVLRWTISIAVLVFVTIAAFGWHYEGPPNRIAMIIAGAVSGLSTGASGMAGPPIVFYFLSVFRDARIVRASLIMYFVLIEIIALAILGVSGAVSWFMLELGVILAPVILLSAWAGAKMFPHVSHDNYRLVALAVIAVIAVGSLAI